MSRKLVAYFSATGTTAGIAEQLSEAIGADLHKELSDWADSLEI